MSKPKSMQGFVAQMGSHGLIRLPSHLLPWKPGTRLFWRCCHLPDRSVSASPDPLGCVYRGRYLSSRIRVLGYYPRTHAQNKGPRKNQRQEQQGSAVVMRRARRIAVHRARLRRIQTVFKDSRRKP